MNNSKKLPQAALGALGLALGIALATVPAAARADTSIAPPPLDLSLRPDPASGPRLPPDRAADRAPMPRQPARDSAGMPYGSGFEARGLSNGGRGERRRRDADADAGFDADSDPRVGAVHRRSAAGERAGAGGRRR